MKHKNFWKILFAISAFTLFTTSCINKPCEPNECEECEECEDPILEGDDHSILLTGRGAPDESLGNVGDS